MFLGRIVDTTLEVGIHASASGSTGLVDVYDGLVFSVDDLLLADPDFAEYKVTVAHPVTTGADPDDLLAAPTVGIAPIDVFASALVGRDQDGDESAEPRFLVYARWDQMIEQWTLVNAAALDSELRVEDSGHPPFTAVEADDSASNVGMIAFEVVDGLYTGEND